MPVIADRLEEVSNLYLLLKQVSFRFGPSYIIDRWALDPSRMLVGQSVDYFALLNKLATEEQAKVGARDNILKIKKIACWKLKKWMKSKVIADKTIR